MPRVPPVLIAALLAGAGLSACTATAPATPGTQGTTRTITGSPVPGSPSTAPSSTAPVPTHPVPSPPGPSVPASGTGIAGLTTINGCPLVRAESPCPNRPIPARLTIVDAATNAVVATLDSDADGRFSIAVKPGHYLLRPTIIAGAPPRPQGPVAVDVVAGRYTTITLRLDSGIR